MDHTGQELKDIFDSYLVLDVNLWNKFSKYLEKRSFKKNEVIKNYNKTERYLNIIIKGSIGVFVLGNNYEHCISLSYENNFSADYLSFLQQKPSPIFTKALEDTLVLSINFSNLNNLYSKSSSGVNFGKIIAERLFLDRQQIQIDLLTLSAEDRYLNLLSKQAKIIERTPLKYIASYIGLTPESLSRIRKNVSTK